MHGVTLLLACLLCLFAASVIATPAPTGSPSTSTPSPIVTNSPTTRSPTSAAPTTQSPTSSLVCPDDPTDTDTDGWTDCNDKCPIDFNKQTPGICGCGISDTLQDVNGDGIPDCSNGQQPMLTGYAFVSAANMIRANLALLALMVLGSLALAA